MFNLGRLAVLSALVYVSALNASPIPWEWDCCEEPSSNRLYIGAFGGGIYSNSNKATQFGTAFFSELTSIGPLSVIGEGRLNKTSSGFGGVQIGYEWSKPLSAWSIASALELEALFFNARKEGYLINQSVAANSLNEHDFHDSFHMNSKVILTNLILSLDHESLFGFSPYVGGGIGAARVSLHKADSFQVSPVEAGINHFNSQRDDSSWAFAAQIKAGLRYNFCELFNIFAEYRYLYVDATNYIFGATNYTVPFHVPTSAWNVKVKNYHYNAFAIGVQFDL